MQTAKTHRQVVPPVRKYRTGKYASGFQLDQAELRAVRDLAARHGHSIADIIRAGALVVIAGQGHAVDPDDYDGALLRLGRRLAEGGDQEDADDE